MLLSLMSNNIIFILSGNHPQELASIQHFVVVIQTLIYQLDFGFEVSFDNLLETCQQF